MNSVLKCNTSAEKYEPSLIIFNISNATNIYMVLCPPRPWQIKIGTSTESHLKATLNYTDEKLNIYIYLKLYSIMLFY